ncbi:MAG: ABC transporter ATP-binding protein/permease [Bacteroidetes bacterium]|nr:ABC transporter ATP-binding protein/permease [Bacteroidota bacterium]
MKAATEEYQAPRAGTVQALKRLFGEMKPYSFLLTGTLLLAIVLAGTAPLRPWLIQQAVDGPMTRKDLASLAQYGWVILALLLGESGLRYLFGLWSVQLGQSVVKDLRRKLYEHLTRYRPSFYESRSVGALGSRVINDLEAIAELFAQGFLTMAGDVLQLIVILSVMLYTDWRLTLVSLMVMPLLLWVTWWFKEKVHSSFTEVRSRTSSLNSFLQERLSNLQLIPLFHREEEEKLAFQKENQGLAEAHLNGVWYYSVYFPVVEVLTALAMGLMVWYGAVSVQDGALSTGVLVAFLVYINQLFRPLRLLADKFNSLQMGIIASSRVFQLIDLKAWPAEINAAADQSTQGIDIQIQNLNFGYQKDVQVLHDIQLRMKPGEVWAVVGSSGSGKSTLAQMLVRFYEPDSGRILLDGLPHTELTLKQLRRRIVYVPQELIFFSGTVLDNIILHDSGITMELVELRVKEFNLLDFVESLPLGFLTSVGEKGAGLSAGQKQLVALIRALVRQPDLLILDEATASVDSATEAQVQRGIEAFVQGRNALLIAHRMSTLRFAHRILVMKDGRIVEEGTHAELLALNGHFSKLSQGQHLGDWLVTSQ